MMPVSSRKRPKMAHNTLVIDGLDLPAVGGRDMMAACVGHIARNG